RTLSLHDALPIWASWSELDRAVGAAAARAAGPTAAAKPVGDLAGSPARDDGDVDPPVPERELVAREEHGVVAPGVVVGAAVGMGELAVELNAEAELDVSAVGPDPLLVDLLPHLQGRLRQRSEERRVGKECRIGWA